jgi:hypothetical protein
MAKVNPNTGKVTVQKGDTPKKIAADISKATGQKVTTAQVKNAISANQTLNARQQSGNTVLFSGTTFKVPQAVVPKAPPPPPGGTGGGGGGGGGISYSYSSDPYVAPPPPPVNVPERDVVSLAQQSINSETITNLLFENIGANELTKFVRHDTVNGINPYYDIISNLSDIKRKFDPSTLISLEKPFTSFFDIYPIRLQDKIPDENYLSDNGLESQIYIDNNGDLVIEFVNVSSSEIVEIQIDTNGTIY